MNEQDDIGDARSRDDNRRRLENATRTRVVFGRWIPVHPYRATLSERVMFVIGCIMLLAIAGGLAAPYLGLTAPFRTYAQLEAASRPSPR